MSKPMKSFNIVPDCPNGVGGALDCLGLCAICETVLESLNRGIEYSEDNGGKKWCVKFLTADGPIYMFDPRELRKRMVMKGWLKDAL